MISGGRARVFRVSSAVVFLVCCALGLITPGASAQSYIFGRADFATGTGPASVITGDFNGDGKLDLAIANSTDNTVSILIGKPDGTFQPHVDYATDADPVAVASGDFNGDGKLDLATANLADNTVSVLLGSGDTQTAELTPSDGATADSFGCSAASSGNTVVIGASQANIGQNKLQGAA